MGLRALQYLIVIGALILLMACGPDTIFLRSGLDTPFQHVQNGNRLLKYNKVDAAFNEFTRAKNLDDQYALAYVGLGLVCARKNQTKEAFVFMQKARKLALGANEIKAVDRGFIELHTHKVKKESQ